LFDAAEITEMAALAVELLSSLAFAAIVTVPDADGAV
jgi:hypothetical protein